MRCDSKDHQTKASSNSGLDEEVKRPALVLLTAPM
jgi:hypothetical protein